MKKGYLLEKLTWPMAKKAFEETSMVVIPVGSTEQHGPHLPVGTDFFLPREIARLLLERSNVIVTPTLPIGYAKYHTMFPGTLSLTEETLKNVLIDICDDLLKYGTTHILFIDGHGGNLNALRQCGEWLRKRCVPSAVVTWWQLAPAIDPSWQAIGHADYIETSAILALDEDLVASLATGHSQLITVEENTIMGGAGSAVLESLESKGLSIKVLQLGLPDNYIDQGDHAQMLANCGLDKNGIIKSVEKIMSE